MFDDDDTIDGEDTSVEDDNTTNNPVVDNGNENDDDENSSVAENTLVSAVSIDTVGVEETRFGSLYSRLTVDGESKCAEFLAPRLILQDRLAEHTEMATFGQFE